ncbi:MAG: class I SAM-dependent methyltransferase [Spirochaetia bacterium]|nr:class I SAM-dependent methyltransferase [Spirochaetia bacterium]
MNIENHLFPGILYLGDNEYPLTASYGSKNSLLINFSKSTWFKDSAEFDRMVLTFDGDQIQLGKCIFVHEKSAPNFIGRLIFTSDVYDFYNIFTFKKMSNLAVYFQNLPLMMAQKNKINESFRKYTSDLTYDLRVYKKFFEELDLIYHQEPPEIYKMAQKTILETEGRKFFTFFDKRLEDLKKETLHFTREEQENHAYFFRRQVWDFIKESRFLTRTNLKPRGYPGDSEMMSMIYRDLYEGETIFEKLMHKHPIETKSAQAVRNRKTMIPEFIKQSRDQFPYLQEKFKILSVASGPARELENIIITPDFSHENTVTLLDQDNEALGEAANCIRRIENRFATKVDYNFLNESVRTMLRIRDLNLKWGQFHFIYSMGLFDYLSARVAQSVIEKLYSLLLPGGRMVIGNYHEANPTKTYMDYWGDWVLYYRSEEEFMQITGNLNPCKKEIVFEDSHCQMFLIIEKPLK